MKSTWEWSYSHPNVTSTFTKPISFIRHCTHLAGDSTRHPLLLEPIQNHKSLQYYFHLSKHFWQPGLYGSTVCPPDTPFHWQPATTKAQYSISYRQDTACSLQKINLKKRGMKYLWHTLKYCFHLPA